MRNSTNHMKDLVILVADKQMEFTLKGLLNRHHSLGIRRITCDIYRHPNSDPGCRTDAHNFLRQFHSIYQYALVLFDWDGCGENSLTKEELAQELVLRLESNGWSRRANCIIIDPELEIWIWSESPEINRCLGWERTDITVQNWLREENHWNASSLKPEDPKHALERVLENVNLPRSASLYEELASRVSFQRCTDPSFLLLKETLKLWFEHTHYE